MNQQHVVTLRAMRFHTHIGVLPHEAEIAQSIEVDLSVWVAAMPTATGSEGVLDYRRLYKIVAGVVSGGHIRYLEQLVDRIAEGVLEIAEVSRVEVKARKPHVALPGPLMYAEVGVERSRDD
jgi:dihydroneopterin aldolase